MIAIGDWTFAPRASGGLVALAPAILLAGALLTAAPAQAGKSHWRGPDHRSHYLRRHYHYSPRWPVWNPGPPHREIHGLFKEIPELADPDACRQVLTRGFAVITRDGDRSLPGARFEYRGTCP